MKSTTLALVLCIFAIGCTSLAEMKLRDGEVGCDTVTTLYGSASRIVFRADNVPKGATSESSAGIKCGSAQMDLTNKVGVPVPAGATTTTTTTVVKPQ